MRYDTNTLEKPEDGLALTHSAANQLNCYPMLSANVTPPPHTPIIKLRVY